MGLKSLYFPESVSLTYDCRRALRAGRELGGVLALAMVPVAFLWWVWIRMLGDCCAAGGRTVGIGSCLTVSAVSLPYS
jgi:hypothetical protein